MNNSQLILESYLVDYDDDMTFKIRANNAYCAASLEFYGTAEEFAKFGNELINFPQNLNHQVSYPPHGLYDESESYAYYLTIKAFCYDAGGNTALEIAIDSRGSVLDEYKANLLIRTDAASLNKFGQKLANWNMRLVSKISLYDEE